MINIPLSALMYLLQASGVRPGNGGAGQHSVAVDQRGGRGAAERCKAKAMTTQVKVHFAGNCNANLPVCLAHIIF